MTPLARTMSRWKNGLPSSNSNQRIHLSYRSPQPRFSCKNGAGLRGPRPPYNGVGLRARLSSLLSFFSAGTITFSPLDDTQMSSRNPCITLYNGEGLQCAVAVIVETTIFLLRRKPMLLNCWN
ncbi:hypothetical protein COCSADRAFT_269886 [Bipolaris sorokiniana ND90Pr]|uniref:Uncharacterized protein n=1 Tax=Cochliobolus sativus (strain ND90Pr / ATCC 201652) TaxID=665912 RepID=M2SLY5_COCSN|nr:uncharacterized protein COCSADRAFT_269886 [Bipolaris sorokiniana ND90Pr]EMD68183.1 hypothetical protein COCSADRAFT_269886 [Bipolaris sorokiniana ND90Pr]